MRIVIIVQLDKKKNVLVVAERAKTLFVAFFGTD